MKDTLRKMFLSFVGAAAMTAEKANELVDELVKKGEITVEEGKKLAKELHDKGEVAQAEFTQKVKKEVEETMSKLGYVKKEEFDKVKSELEGIKKGNGKTTKTTAVSKAKKSPVAKKANK